MKRFNHERAWAVLARPAFEALPADVRALVDRVGMEAATLRQGPDLDMPWPEGLRARFEAIPAEILAQASMVVYSYGHWAKMGHWSQANGIYWKFSNYADQVLAAKLGIPRERTKVKGHGLSFSVVEGVIRAGVSTPDSWFWVEIGPATMRTWEACNWPFPSVPGTRLRSEWLSYEERMRKDLKAIASHFRDDLGCFGYLDGFMEESYP